MKSFLISALLLIALCIQQAQANDVNDSAGRSLSIAELKERVFAPRIFAVTAYVIEKYDKCPPCPPNAVCETCVFGIYVADDNRPRKPGTTMTDGIYLPTNKAQRFQIGMKYQFRIRYRIEKNAAGAWQQTGPELIDFSHSDQADNRK